MSAILSSEEKKTLLKIARQAICSRVNGEEYRFEPVPLPGLNLQCGCFVTITRNGHLRGCIGNFSSAKPLQLEVAQMAMAAATGDPRFQPMRPEELNDFSLEVSVLSPLQRVSDTSEIEIGRHGIYLEMGDQRGVLLPQVAIEHNWGRDMFLQQTCRKAGLAADAWQAADIKIYVFSATIFSEE